MAEIFDFYVADNRTIKFNPIEPILQEDNGVAVWRFRIPKVLNNIDMSGFAWWFVYVNAAKQKYSEPLTLIADTDNPDNYCIADYTIDYGISLTPGSFTFALEAINANGSGDIVEEWHTKTYSHSVVQTLQGNQTEYSETESDIISALIVQIQQKYNALVGGATPIPVASVSAMTDTSKIYLNTTDKNWYFYNGFAWVSGGLYASGIVIDPTLTQSGQAADAKVVGDEIATKVSKPTSSPNGTAGQLLRTNGDGTTQWVDQGLPTDEQTAEAIDEWLTNHPEATTTVQDGSLTYKKLVTGTLGFVTPEMFGAVGDGVTDDTDAIQSAINTRNIVFFSSKNYMITESLMVYDGSTLVGCGAESIIEFSQEVDIGKCITTSENNLSDITILSLFFKGHCDENTDDESGLVAIELLHANNIDIENCLFSGFHKNIELTVCTNCRVVNNKILNATEMATSKINGYGILLERGNNIVIDNNTMEEIERHAIYVNAATDVVITNNIISAKATNKGSGYEGNIKINGAKNIIVTNNNIQGNGYGIGLLGELTEGSTFGCEKVTIANNIVHDCIYNAGFARGLIGCCSNHEYFDIVIRDNILYMSEVPSFTIRGINIDQGTFKNLQIKNNVVDTASVGIYVRQTELVVVDGNICKNCNTAYGFYNNDSKIFGDVNYHTNCTNGVLGTDAQLRRSYMSTGIIDTGSENYIILSTGDITVQADKTNVFVGPSSGYANIKGISGGIPGEIVTFRSPVGGSVKIASNASTTMKLDASKGNFTGAVGIIQFKKIDTTWFEICRTAI